MTALSHHTAKPGRHSRPLRRLAIASAMASALLAAGTAHAVLGTPGNTESDGGMTDIAYGNTGNIFELFPRLFVQGLGSPGNPQDVTGRNPLLQYSFAVSGIGTDAMDIVYSVHNSSAKESFNQLRLMVFANPDGGPDYMDTVKETWGPAVNGGPVEREVHEALNADPADNILSRFALNSTLVAVTFPRDAACTAGGCDANVGLQWNAGLLGPGETFQVRLGLSDSGKSLSSRFLTVSSVSDPGTVLTLSGVGNVVAVPEPGSSALMLAGLLGIGYLVQRRRPGG